MKSDVRRRLNRLATEVGLCPRCINEEKRDAEISALAERIHRNIQQRLAERDPEDLREQAQRLLEAADALEAAEAQPPLGVPAVEAPPSHSHLQGAGSREEAPPDHRL